MRAAEHPDFHHEEQHLRAIIERIRTLHGTLGSRELEAASGLAEILEGAAKPEDLDMLQQQQLQSINRRALLRLAEKDPYFGRVDLTTLDYLFNHNLSFEKIATDRSPGAEKITENKRDSIYIGKIGVESEETGDQVIIDWRAPVADLYYAGSTGRTFFHGPYGPVNCDVHLLRRFMVHDGHLTEISDVEDDGGGVDDYLLARLQQNADTGMKDIVSTIRRDQNEIIRMTLGQPVIVQGVAGSGKTSVALHRLSYLLYANKGRIFPEDTLILTPSQLFFGYIASVMPGLDIKRCRQSTFTDLALRELGLKLQITSPNQTMAQLCRANRTTQQEAEWARLLPARRAKGSLELLAGLERYLDFLAAHALPAGDIRVGKTVLVDRQTIEDRYHDLRHLTLQRRVDEMKKWLTRTIKPALTKRSAEIRERFERSLERVRRRRSLRDEHLPNPEAIRMINERDLTVARLEEGAKQAVNEFRKQMPSRLDVLGIYRQFISTPELLSEFAPELDQETISGLVILAATSTKNKLEQEDLAPLLKVHERVNGLTHAFVHVVIDEAQDLNPAELAMIRRWLGGGSSMTVVGDLAQGIYPHRGLDDWRLLSDQILEGKDIYFREMRRSYRSSAEIINLANVVLKLDPAAPAPSQAVRLTGHKPQVIEIGGANHKETAKRRAELVREALQRYSAEEFKSVAVIVKTHELGRELHKQLADEFAGRLTLVLEENDHYDSPLVIIPTYLAKGLEFDVVIIPDADAQTYDDNPFDQRLLYVAMTRPLHRLTILYNGELTKPLGEADEELFAPHV